MTAEEFWEWCQRHDAEEFIICISQMYRDVFDGYDELKSSDIDLDEKNELIYLDSRFES